MSKVTEPTLKVRCPHCQAAVDLGRSVVQLGGRAALVCPECEEVTVA